LYSPGDSVLEAATAVRIAIVAWIPVYGVDEVRLRQPYEATLVGDAWFVAGTLPPGTLGGTPNAEVARRDGRVRRVWHPK
jgi:hypothetical protein